VTNKQTNEQTLSHDVFSSEKMRTVVISWWTICACT